MKDFDFDSLLSEETKDSTNELFNETVDCVDYTDLIELENKLKNRDFQENIFNDELDIDFKQETILFMLAYWDRKIQTKKRIENEKKIEQMFSEYGVNIRASKHALNQYLKSIKKTDSDRKAEIQHDSLVEQISSQLDISEFKDNEDES